MSFLSSIDYCMQPRIHSASCWINEAREEYSLDESLPCDDAFAIVDFGEKDLVDAKNSIRDLYKKMVMKEWLDWKEKEVKASLTRMKLRSGRHVGESRDWAGMLERLSAADIMDMT
ncbi:MAG: hypothetical protein Q9223_005763 [Gallowayella weberi]